MKWELKLASEYVPPYLAWSITIEHGAKEGSNMAQDHDLVQGLIWIGRSWVSHSWASNSFGLIDDAPGNGGLQRRRR